MKEKRNKLEKIILSVLVSGLCFGTYPLCRYLSNNYNGDEFELRKNSINYAKNENRIEKRVDRAKIGRYCERKISQEGIDLIKRFEGYSENVYLDVAGKKTIGYGHLIRGNENYERITKEKAELLLRKDLEEAENAVKKYVKVELSQNQYDALVSFVYNIGIGNFRKSMLLEKLNKRDYNGAANEFERWIYANGKRINGLEKRRNAEKELFSKK